MRELMSVIGLLVATPAMGQDNAAALNLVCPGKAAREESSTPGLFGPPKTALRVDYEDAVYLRLRADNTGEARLPKRIQSKYKQDKDGWFPLVNVTRSSEQVDGQVRLHSMYKPKFHIDRITGQLTISGSLGDFAGQCSTYNPDSPATKF